MCLPGHPVESMMLTTHLWLVHRSLVHLRSDLPSKIGGYRRIASRLSCENRGAMQLSVVLLVPAPVRHEDWRHAVDHAYSLIMRRRGFRMWLLRYCQHWTLDLVPDKGWQSTPPIGLALESRQRY